MGIFRNGHKEVLEMYSTRLYVKWCVILSWECIVMLRGLRKY